MHSVTGEYSFCSLERARIVHSILFAPLECNGANIQEYVSNGRICEVFPVHDPEVRNNNFMELAAHSHFAGT